MAQVFEAGQGHLHQGRFKSFPIQSDDHLLTVLRYVERNPLRAKFVDLAEAWKWGSAYARQQKPVEREWLQIPDSPSLPRQWRSLGNQPQTQAEVDAVRKCLRRGMPFGDENWMSNIAARLSLQSTTRPRGRPRRDPTATISQTNSPPQQDTTGETTCTFDANGDQQVMAQPSGNRATMPWDYENKPILFE